jgi:hypothetical protein
LGGAGAEHGEVLRGAALPRVRAGQCAEAEIAANVGDDVGDRAQLDVVVEVGRVEPVEQFGVQGLGLGVPGGALDGVFDLADDAPAGGCAMLIAGHGGDDGFGDLAREGDGAADPAGDAVERDGDFGAGCGGLLLEPAGEAGADVDQAVQDPAIVLRVRRLLVGKALRFDRGGLS